MGNEQHWTIKMSEVRKAFGLRDRACKGLKSYLTNQQQLQITSPITAHTYTTTTHTHACYVVNLGVMLERCKSRSPTYFLSVRLAFPILAILVKERTRECSTVCKCLLVFFFEVFFFVFRIFVFIYHSFPLPCFSNA